ncbi:MAG: type I-C CRISPR-associated protein Cas5c [Eubacteriales bacterium]|nr:type I-C CRISPR-associated protein Cas5c [Eubacteriales bacterium]
MGYGFCVRIRGDMALFTNPAAKAERYTYPDITPSAARGIIESIFWKPGLRYRIDAIQVNNRIRYDSVRRNEVGAVAKLGTIRTAYNHGGALYIDSTAERQQRASVILRDVDYCVWAHFELVREKMQPTDDEKKFYNILLRRLRKGQFHSPAYLGCREFAAVVTLHEGDAPPSYYADTPEQDMGYILYDMEYGQTEAQPVFFHAIMRHGVITPEVAP